jgi:DNA-binding CsgD family transcriptional regulator
MEASKTQRGDGVATVSLGLTPREHQVLELVAVGEANKLIARDLGMTEHTVKFHLASIFRKLDVTNRTEAAATYLRVVNES